MMCSNQIFIYIYVWLKVGLLIVFVFHTRPISVLSKDLFVASKVRDLRRTGVYG